MHKYKHHTTKCTWLGMGALHSSMNKPEQLSHLKNETTVITHALEKMILFMLNEHKSNANE